MAARGPGPIAVVHRLLIATALLATLAYAAWEAAGYARTGEIAQAAWAALGVLVAIGIALYLRSLRGLAARLTPSGSGGAEPVSSAGVPGWGSPRRARAARATARARPAGGRDRCRAPRTRGETRRARCGRRRGSSRASRGSARGGTGSADAPRRGG